MATFTSYRSARLQVLYLQDRMFQLRNSSTTVANLRHTSTRAIHISLIIFLLYLTITLTADEVSVLVKG